MMEEDYLELLELQQLIRDSLEEAFPERVRVRAEVASMQARANGHCYLELCQDGPGGMVAKMRAVIWRSRAGSLLGAFAQATGSPLQAGMAVVFEGRVNYSELYGMSLVIDGIDVRQALGEAELRRRLTIERLGKEGLTELQKEFSLPRLPYSLAVISASDAAGYGDFLHHLTENEYGFAFSVTLFEATMQGEGAPSSIIAALERILSDEGRSYDAVLILRGGGSVLDLGCFDDYGLCAAIARYPIPVCTAIGHERDEHAADLVACISVKTPTALADLFIDAVAQEDEMIGSLGQRIRIALSRRLGAEEEKVETAVMRLRFALRHMVTAEEAGLSVLEARISAANPRKLLERGYSIVTGPKGAPLRRAADAQEGDKIDILFPDGTLNCIVNGKI